MVVPQKMQEAVQREHPKLCLIGMSGFACLTLRHTGGDDDVAKHRGPWSVVRNPRSPGRPPTPAGRPPSRELR